MMSLSTDTTALRTGLDRAVQTLQAKFHQLREWLLSDTKQETQLPMGLSKSEMRHFPYNHFQVLPKSDPDHANCDSYVYEPIDADFQSKLSSHCQNLFEKGFNSEDNNKPEKRSKIKEAYKKRKKQMKDKIDKLSGKFKDKFDQLKIQRMPVAVMLKMLEKILPKWKLDERDDAELIVMSAYSLASKYHLDKDETYSLQVLLDTFDIHEEVNKFADYEFAASDAMEFTFSTKEYEDAKAYYDELFPGCSDYNEKCYEHHHVANEQVTMAFDRKRDRQAINQTESAQPNPTTAVDKLTNMFSKLSLTKKK